MNILLGKRKDFFFFPITLKDIDCIVGNTKHVLHALFVFDQRATCHFCICHDLHNSYVLSSKLACIAHGTRHGYSYR